MSEEGPRSAQAILAEERLAIALAKEAFIGPLEQRIRIRSTRPLSEEEIQQICDKHKAPRSRVDLYVLDGLFYKLVEQK